MPRAVPSSPEKSGENSGQHDVFQGGHNRNQVEGLEDVADGVTTQEGQFLRVQLCHINVVDKHGSAIGLIQSTDHIKEGGFSRPGRPHDADILAALDVERDSLEGLCHLVAHLKLFDQIFGANDIFNSVFFSVCAVTVGFHSGCCHYLFGCSHCFFSFFLP